MVRCLFDVRFCLTKCRRHDFEALPVSIRARPLIGLPVVKSEMILSLLSTNSQESLFGPYKSVKIEGCRNTLDSRYLGSCTSTFFSQIQFD
jgi:hypothetical protein